MSLGQEARLVVVGQVASAVIALIAIRVITEVLSPGVFGLATLVLACIQLGKGLLVAPILAGQLRYDPTAMRRKETGDLYSAIGQLGLVAVAGAVVVSVGLVVALRLPIPYTALRWLAPVLALWLIADTLIALCSNALNSRRLQGRLSLLSVADSAARPATAVMLIVLVAPGALVYVGGRAAGALIGLVSVGLILRLCGDRVTGLFERSPVRRTAWRKKLVSFGWPLVPVSILSWTIHLADRVILNAFHDSAAVGVYAAYYGLASQPFLMLSGSLTLVLRPHMFEAADGNIGEVHKYRTTWLRWLALVGGVGILLAAVFREPISRLFLAPAYRMDTGLLVIIGGAYLLLAFGQSAENYLLAGEKTRLVLKVSVWSTLVSVLAAIVLIPPFAAYGAAWSTFAGLATYATLMWLSQSDPALAARRTDG